MLTDVRIRKLKPQTSRFEVWDTKLPGFGVRVSPSGTKSFVLMYRANGNKVRRTLGKYPVLALSDARKEAQSVLRDVSLGIEVRPRTAPSDSSFVSTVDSFVEIHCDRKNREGTARETERLLVNNFGPHIGRKQIADITPKDITDVLDKMASTPSEANHSFAAVRKFFNWCCERQLISSSPCASLSMPNRTQSRDRILSDDELKDVYLAAAEKMGYPYGTIVCCLIRTGQRQGELTQLQWSDIQDSSIIIPAERSKNHREHVYPITPALQDILDTVPQFETPLVFPAVNNHENTYTMSSRSKKRLDKRSGVSGWRLHDLRRTAASGLAALGTQPHIIEAVLNHKSGVISGVAAVYNRYAYIKEMREALDAWDEKLDRILAS